MSKEASLRWYNNNKYELAARRRLRKSKGLCTNCGKKARDGFYCCQSCATKYAAQRRKQWSKRAKAKPSLKWSLIKLKGGKCQDCGYRKHHAALEFDHVRGKKIDAVANLINTMVSWDRVLKEVEKCELVCANCHAVRTWNRSH